jgi:chromosome segregation ATPase
MKNFQQNLLIVLALGLCALCVYYWHDQTGQRNQIEKLNQIVYAKTAEIEGYTNSIKTMERQIAQMDELIGGLRQTISSNELAIVAQKRELNHLETQTEALTNEVSQYQRAVETLEARLKEAYDGVKKQNDAIKELAAQRDEYVKKYNDSVTERNDIVNKYNDLVARFEKLQPGGGKAPDK